MIANPIGAPSQLVKCRDVGLRRAPRPAPLIAVRIVVGRGGNRQVGV
jgi:hypothetical protein